MSYGKTVYDQVCFSSAELQPLPGEISRGFNMTWGQLRSIVFALPKEQRQELYEKLYNLGHRV